jgi:hypothetical protein
MPQGTPTQHNNKGGKKKKKNSKGWIRKIMKEKHW